MLAAKSQRLTELAMLLTYRYLRNEPGQRRLAELSCEVPNSLPEIRARQRGEDNELMMRVTCESETRDCCDPVVRSRLACMAPFHQPSPHVYEV
jgi:hypothetical protein